MCEKTVCFVKPAKGDGMADESKVVLTADQLRIVRYMKLGWNLRGTGNALYRLDVGAINSWSRGTSVQWNDVDFLLEMGIIKQKRAGKTMTRFELTKKGRKIDVDAPNQREEAVLS